MKLFQSPMALTLLLAAAALIRLGTGWKKGHVLSFFGGLCFAFGAVAALVDGAAIQELLIVAMTLFLLSQWKGGRKA